ncbi:phosphatidylglycerophosphatase A [Marivivens sp.]|uniref:phosphatidylglycerophosphatase A family protein n=1 Tax=Marivivens sp. TaxID=1978374 RepID=UPI0025B7C3EE|nr:phosphatidylglycerophosphatase A [Marivivens sp.]
MKEFARLAVTVFYVGLLRPAPGTWGSLAALPFAWAIYQIGGVWFFAFAIVAGFIKGLYFTNIYIDGKEDHDPSEVVIDEVIGQWIALAPVIYGASMMNIDVTRLWPGWVCAFIFFRLFDITKPGPVGWADRKGGAMGVMLDDVIAGVFAAIVTIGFAALFHLVLM